MDIASKRGLTAYQLINVGMKNLGTVISRWRSTDKITKKLPQKETEGELEGFRSSNMSPSPDDVDAFTNIRAFFRERDSELAKEKFKENSKIYMKRKNIETENDFKIKD